MTSPNRRLSLEEVLDEFFFSADKPSPTMVLRACKAHPEYREDILEFAALWSSYEASPKVAIPEAVAEDSEESASRLQSFVLNCLHELESKPESESDEAAARAAIAELAGAKLRRAAAAAGLGACTSLLNKVLTKRIRDVPGCVLNDLAQHLNIGVSGLQRCLGFGLAGGMSYKASGKPNMPQVETWANAVHGLPVSQDEKERLLALQGNEDSL
jgi:hypothetical protein